jgi:hypothetical protein
MLVKRHLLIVMVGFLALGAPLNEGWAQGGGDKTEQVKVAYEKARRLYRQGKYNDAIKAFDEVKDLQYHPILDYGLANCYEAQRDYAKATYYLEKYLNNYSKFTMSPKHPSLDDVKEKIKALKARIAAGASDPGTPPTPPPTDATPGGSAGDPVPGPDPYAVPPPPGGDGATPPGGQPPGQPYAPPPGPYRRSLILSLDVGASAMAAAGASGWYGDTGTGGGLYFSAIWRFIPYLGLGLNGGFSVVGSSSSLTDSNVLFGVVALELRGFVPLGRMFDLWAGLGIGYGASSSGSDYSVAGPALAVTLGFEWFVSRMFSVGLITRLYRMFPTKYCAWNTTENERVCGSLPDNADTGVVWYFGVSGTYHLPLVGRRR